MDEDCFFISLWCTECENVGCKYIWKNNGCKRKVDEDTYIDYIHLLNEEWPFRYQWDKKEVDETYVEIISLLNKIYDSPIEENILQNQKFDV